MSYVQLSARPSFARWEMGGEIIDWPASAACVLTILLCRCFYSRAACSNYWCITCCWCCVACLLLAMTLFWCFAAFLHWLLVAFNYICSTANNYEIWEMDAIIFTDTWGRYFDFYGAVVGVVTYQKSTYLWLLLPLCCDCCWRWWRCLVLVLLYIYCCCCCSCCSCCLSVVLLICC